MDLGLVGVGVEERRNISFTNESDVWVRYFFKVNPDVDAELLGILFL